MATLSQLRDRLNSLIAQQGEDAPCAYWIYTKEDAYVIDEDGEYNYIYDEGAVQAEGVTEALEELIEVDYVYTVIQAVSYTHPPSPRDATLSRMPSSA